MKNWHACEAATLEARVMYIQLYVIANDDWLDVEEKLAIDYLVSMFELYRNLHLLKLALLENEEC